MISLLAVEWSLGIGDPTVVGWTITCAYAIAAWMCLKAGARANARKIEGLTRFWLACSFLLLLMCVNKQLDLQKLATETARAIARDEGWYKERKAFQWTVLLTSGFIALALAVSTAWLMRRHLRTLWPVFVGALIIVLYVAMRATSHHDIDALMRAGPVPLRDSMELVGIAAIVFGAMRREQPAVNRA